MIILIINNFKCIVSKNNFTIFNLKTELNYEEKESRFTKRINLLLKNFYINNPNCLFLFRIKIISTIRLQIKIITD